MKIPVVLFFITIALLFFLNYYRLAYYENNSIRLEETILEKLNNIKCVNNNTPPPPIQCPNVTIIKEKEPCENGNGVGIFLHEMTSYLNENIKEGDEVIFFTETTGHGVIKPRFVCAVESAARAYPNGKIFLIMAFIGGQLPSEINESLTQVLKHYKNVQVLRVEFDKLFKNTPLEEFYKSGKLMNSKYLPAHTSDILRFLTVWLYGGKYFDLDVITIRNLTGIDYFIIDESQLPNNYLANCCFSYKKGSEIGTFIFDLISREFNPDDWAANGPRVFTDALRWYTGVDRAIDMNETNLKEFKKLRYEQLFPIEYFDLLLYFSEDLSDSTMNKIFNVSDLIGLHIGNNLINNEIVNVDSKQPYSLLAQKYCPRAYWSAYKIF